MAETASDLKLKHHRGSLLILCRVADDEPYIARCIAVTERGSARDLGHVIVRFSRAQDALAMSLTGWVLARVGANSKLTSAKPGDRALAESTLRTYGIHVSHD